MAAPYLGDVAVPYGVPGASLAPPSFNMGIRDPGIQSWQTMSDSIAADMNYGMPPDVSVVETELSNFTISRHYTVFPFGDGSEEKIRKQMIAFVTRHQNAETKEFDAYYIASLAKVNTTIREQHANFREMVELGIPDATTFRDLLRDLGEDRLEAYHAAVSRTGMETMTPEMMVAAFGADLNDLKTLYALSKKSVFCYMTKLGITQRWNYLGVVISIGQNAETLHSIDTFSVTPHSLVVGVAVGGRVRVSSVWSGIQSGSRLYLILRRMSPSGLPGLARAEHRPYQFIPFATDDNTGIPLSELRFADAGNEPGAENPRLTEAVVIPFGLVNLAQGLYYKTNEEARQDAIGLNSTYEQSYRAVAALADIEVDMICAYRV